ncbi:MAG: anthranilate synthase component I family protein [Balneolaceae bacterium]|nr:anthranilate synthase component I family protein [Balneolaceae bacterium]
MKTLPEKLTIDGIYERLARFPLMILESQLENHRSSKYSYIAAKPKNSIVAHGTNIEIFEEGDKTTVEMNPWEALKWFRSEKKRWLFGFLGYDLKNHIEELESANPPLTDIPDLYFMEPEILIKVADGNFELLSGDFTSDSETQKTLPGTFESELSPLIRKEEYTENVKSIQQKIHQGDFYEMNYTFPLCGSYLGDPYWLYSSMREISPVPFGAFISDDKFSVCCASPERFLKKEGDRILSEPIKGTAARSVDSELDSINREQLMNEKNRAENLMIVDLVRHDLSRVSKPGSVKVSNLYDVQTFGTVHQLISTVESVALENIDPVDIIQSCFPMGSMTGAPKIEVMKVTDKIEMYKRGIYSGAIGYFTPDDDFDFNVVIRTAILQGDSLFYPVGGAITSDSDPDAEWEECMIKSRNVTEIFLDEPNV